MVDGHFNILYFKQIKALKINIKHLLYTPIKEIVNTESSIKFEF